MHQEDGAPHPIQASGVHLEITTSLEIKRSTVHLPLIPQVVFLACWLKKSRILDLNTRGNGTLCL